MLFQKEGRGTKIPAQVMQIYCDGNTEEKRLPLQRDRINMGEEASPRYGVDSDTPNKHACSEIQKPCKGL